MIFKWLIAFLNEEIYTYNVSNFRIGDAFSNLVRIALQSFLIFMNDHVPKPIQVIGRRIQLANLSPALIPVLATTAPVSIVISPASGRDFTIIPPTSANPLITDPTFLPILLVSLFFSFEKFFFLHLFLYPYLYY